MKNLLTIILTLAFSISAFTAATPSEKKDTNADPQQEANANQQPDENSDEQDPSVKKKKEEAPKK
ncbi:hypothetical protein [Candidatus Tisiphia endosymbiont of Hybos culiciformis]|uniref:hypothetical protein n=1 Tax=Candidatus Tisiphia endosymbiont of Hybos culiciformis TaxID=3139331 RepID=UPI003CCB1790